MISCEEPPLTGYEFGQIQRAFLHGLGLALMMGRLLCFGPSVGFHRGKQA